MTLTVKIKAKTEIPLDSVFRIAQAIVRTPAGTEPEVKENYYANPPCIGADAWLATYKEDDSTIVELDIPYAAAENMKGLVYSIVHNLRLDDYDVHNEFTDEWHHKNFDFL